MNITSVSDLTELSKYAVSSNSIAKENRNASFESLFQSAIDMVKETNSYTNAAEEQEIAFALGTSDSTADLQAAQAKANISLQYTVTVRNQVLDAYKEIMNLQF